jgi:hypothetical protein
MVCLTVELVRNLEILTNTESFSNYEIFPIRVNDIDPVFHIQLLPTACIDLLLHIIELIPKCKGKKHHWKFDWTYFKMHPHWVHELVFVSMKKSNNLRVRLANT